MKAECCQTIYLYYFSIFCRRKIILIIILNNLDTGDAIEYFDNDVVVALLDATVDVESGNFDTTGDGSKLARPGGNCCGWGITFFLTSCTTLISSGSITSIGSSRVPVDEFGGVFNCIRTPGTLRLLPAASRCLAAAEFSIFCW